MTVQWPVRGGRNASEAAGAVFCEDILEHTAGVLLPGAAQRKQRSADVTCVVLPARGDCQGRE